MNICKVENCGRPVKAYGHCQTHHKRLKLYGSLELPIRKCKTKTSVIQVWRERHGYGTLPPEWMDFWKFYEDVGEKPSSEHYLRKKDPSKPYSKDNFEWIEHIKKRPDEDELTWKKRKWQQRLKLKPSLKEYGGLFRELLKATGISLEEYSIIYLEKSIAQKDHCAICNNLETKFNHRSNKTSRLALDHCHKSNKLRDLLCSRCNRALGKMEESIEYLNSMIQYIQKYIITPTGIVHNPKKSLDFFYSSSKESRTICEICGNPERIKHKTGSTYRLCVDHDHSTNIIRGLLCHRCNTILGHMEESIPYLQSMIAYLEKHK